MTIDKHQEALSACSKTTLDLKAFQDYIKQKNLLNATLDAFYKQDIFLKLRLNGFIRRQISEDRMISRFKALFGGPVDTIVCFGDWEQMIHRKFKPPHQGKGLRDTFRRADYQVFLVDEFRTSKMCCRCGDAQGICETFKIHPGKQYKEHGLLRCLKCNTHWARLQLFIQYLGYGR